MRIHRPFLLVALATQLALPAGQSHAQGSTAQTPSRAERKAEAREASREFQSGEGNPIPDARPKTSRAERSAARQARKPAGAQASKQFHPGEGDPIPVQAAKVPRAERKAASAARRAEIRRANKAHEIPSYGEDYGTKK